MDTLVMISLRIYQTIDPGESSFPIAVYETLRTRLSQVNANLVMDVAEFDQWLTLTITDNFTGILVLERLSADMIRWLPYHGLEPFNATSISAPGVYVLHYTPNESQSNAMRLRVAELVEGYITINVQRHEPTPVSETLMERLTMPRSRDTERSIELNHFLNVANIQQDDVVWIKCEEEFVEEVVPLVEQLSNHLPHRNLIMITPHTIGIESLSVDDMFQSGWGRIETPEEVTQRRLEESAAGALDREPLMVSVRDITHRLLRGEITEGQWTLLLRETLYAQESQTREEVVNSHRRIRDGDLNFHTVLPTTLPVTPSEIEDVTLDQAMALMPLSVAVGRDSPSGEEG